MTQVQGFGDKVGFIWSIADLLRGDYRRHEYGQVILPFTVLRRLDCVLEGTKDAVVAKAADLKGKIENVEPILLRTAGQPFYNTSPLNFRRLLDDPANLAGNLRTYITGYSTGAVEVLREYRFDDTVTRLDNAGLLFHVVSRFADADLHPDAVPNDAMGYIFEELLRKFSEMSNETAGEHFTPREVIKLMVNILFSEDDDLLRGGSPVRTMFDCACGTGGMLTGGQEHLAELNPKARLEVFGQELNPETWAIARSDMMIKGQDPSRIRLGNSLSDDQFAGQTFDYMIANPPFGVDWKRIQKELNQEQSQLGYNGRFGAGLPRISDGSLLFLQHLMSKMKPADRGGSRVAIVFSGSPLFSGGAGSGESEIRRWIIEKDMLEAVVALPDQLFYNTGINTYFWIVTNRKTDRRRGKVVLLDARGEYAKMRRSLGDKRKYLNDQHVADITTLYQDAIVSDDSRVRVVSNQDLGYQRITVERPLRRRWVVSEASLPVIETTKSFLQADIDHAAVGRGLRRLTGLNDDDEAGFVKRVLDACGIEGQGSLPPQAKKAVLDACAVRDPEAAIIRDRKGRALPDAELRDSENVPLSQSIDEYLRAEVLPQSPEAWVDTAKTRIGYEIPFTRYFYEYVPPRDIAVVDAEVQALEAEIRKLLQDIAR